MLLTGNQSGAIQAFRQSVQLAPRRSAYFLHLGLALKQSGALAEAREATQKALELGKESHATLADLAELHRLLGEICLDLKELEAAAAEFDQALKCLSEDREARKGLGCALFGLNRYTEAIPILEPVAADSSLAMFQLARCLAQNDRHDQAVEWLERLTTREPINPQAFYFLGLGYAHQGRFPSAVEAFGQSIAQDGAQPGFLLQRANALMQLGQREAARIDYQQALSLAQEDTDTLFHLGCFSRQVGEEEAAIEYLSRVVQQAPQHLSAFLALGELLEKAGRFLEALEAYKAAAALAPQNPVMSRRMGVLHYRQGEHEATAARLQESAALGDDSDELLYYQGQVAAARQDWDVALEVWGRMRHRHPEDEPLSLNLYNLRYLLGRQHLEAGRLPEAIQEWQSCAGEHPQDDEVRHDLAALHFRLALQELADGSPPALAAARAALEQAHCLYPDNPQYHYYFALCQLAEGRGEEFLGTVEALLPHLDTRTRLHAQYHQAISLIAQGTGEKAAALLSEVQDQVDQQGLGLDVSLPLALMQAGAGRWQEAAELLSASPSPQE
jgi:tetratricopeptide (TPR) repeat protein